MINKNLNTVKKIFDSQFPPKKCFYKIFLTLAIFFVFILGIMTGTLIPRKDTHKLKTNYTDQADLLEKKVIPNKTNTSETSKNLLGNTIKYQDLPVFPNVFVTDDIKLEGGGRRIAYETDFGINSKQVMDFYEKELSAQGWRRILRDVGDSQLEMLAIDQTKFRVWIYFEGPNLDEVDQLPLTFIVDFGPPMGEMLPVPIQ